MDTNFLSCKIEDIILQVGGLWQLFVEKGIIYLIGNNNDKILKISLRKPEVEHPIYMHWIDVNSGKTIEDPFQRKYLDEESSLYEWLTDRESILTPQSAEDICRAICPSENSIFKVMKQISSTFWNVQGSSDFQYTFRYIHGDERVEESRQKAFFIILNMKSGWFTLHYPNTEIKEIFRLPKRQFEALKKGKGFEKFSSMYRCNNDDKIFPSVSRLYKLMVHSFAPWYVNNPKIYPVR